MKYIRLKTSLGRNISMIGENSLAVWSSCDTSRGLIAPNLYSDLENIEGVVVSGTSDCLKRGELLIGSHQIGSYGRNYKMRVCLGKGVAVHEPIDLGHRNLKDFSARRRNVEGVLRSYGLDSVIASFSEAGLEDRYFTSK